MAAVVTETMAVRHRMRTPVTMDYPSRHAPGTALTTTETVPPPAVNADFPRSASYTYIPHAKEQYYGSSNVFTIKGSFSEADLIAPTEDGGDVSPVDSSGWTTPEEYDTRTYPDRAPERDLAEELHNSAKMTVQRLANLEDTVRSSEPSLKEKKSSTESASTVSSSRPRERSSASTSASRKLKRKSWYSVATTPDSRSPSPPKKELEKPTKDVKKDDAVSPAVSSSKRKSFIKKRETIKPANGRSSSVSGTDTQVRPPTRRSSSFVEKVKRPVSGIFSRANTDDPANFVPAVPAIPVSFSTDRLPSAAHTSYGLDSVALPPRIGPGDRLHTTAPLTIPRRKDELWSVFRALDGDFAKFTSKSVAFKANVVRSSLIPFLRSYPDHPSTYRLRPEDVDRRASILNKWWTGLIEMLHGRNNQSISGTDRPAILDGISGIMERPEWRLSPSPFCPLDRRMKGAPKSRSTTSLSSSTSDFLFDSVHHNVRNIFVQNLRSQMAFVVDKMSLRNASASLVTFCGKACAYAFMFVPGMADVLVRLWDLQAETLRRVLQENDLDKFDSLRNLSEEVASRFPPCLAQLAYTSLAQYNRRLRTPPPLPLGTTNIQWWGYWLERWTGRESDLFYVFVKHYHILVTDFLPTPSSKHERMCVPGMLLVHAQILSNLDAAIHREGVSTTPEPAAVATTPSFEDVLADSDAIASTLPLPPLNATRLMAENRLIMLIRDFLSDRVTQYPSARQLFAESFNDLLQAATRGISVYDPAACYTLLDLLEEALVILVRYEHISTGVGTLINSEFWHLMCKRMISSENTLTEIRLYAFLYTIWHTVVCDLGRKTNLCLGLLLDPDIFASRFNHWSPMVRAYYMRLLCWRVARFDGQSGEGDFDILETLLERLQSTWSHYLWQRDEAMDSDAMVPPQTSPCNPAPCRRLLIIRTDAHVASPGAFPSFDLAIPPMVTPAQRAATKRFSTLSSAAELETRPSFVQHRAHISDPTPQPTSGLRGFLRGVLGSRSRSQSQSSAASLPPTRDGLPTSLRPDGTLGLIRAATEELNKPKDRSRSGSKTSPSVAKSHRSFSFKFSLEYNANTKQPGPLRLVPPRLPMPAQRFLNATSGKANSPFIMAVVEPTGVAKARVAYCGRALAEWALVVGECQSFFDRRRNEGVPENKLVETPTLGVEVFKRPG